MILLDTHVWAWLAGDARRLSRRAASAIRRALRSGGIGIASISMWELAMMFARGRLRSPGSIDASIREMVEATGVVVKEITPEVAGLATQFGVDFPGDPADRLIAATARSGAYPLVTSDERIRASALLNTIW